MTAPGIAAAPLAVWDSNNVGGLFWRNWREASEWAIAHIGEAESTCRVEFHMLDGAFAVVHRLARNGAGRVMWDQETEGPVWRDPVVQALDELPPAHLLGIAAKDAGG